MSDPTPHGIDVAFRSETGRTRRHNEDFASYYEPGDPHELAVNGRLYLVADGVGGASAGEVASRYAVRKALAEYYASEKPDLETRLVGAIEVASADIYHFAAARPRSMATTLVAALLCQDELIIANVGDSRAYLVRAGEIRQVTQDHSVVAQMMRRGQLSAEAAKNHPRRNLLTRTVGGAETVEVDVFGGPLRLGDVVVLCTDGLTRYVSAAEIAEAVRTMRPQQAVDELTALANKRGGKDNITALVLQVVEPDDDLDTQRSAPAIQTIETPDLEEELARTIVAKHPFEGPWWRVPISFWDSPLAIAAAAALILGLILLVLGGVGVGGEGKAPAAATQTPSALFDDGVAVRFSTPATLRERPAPQAGAVFRADAGQPAQVLGRPTWDEDGTVWRFLTLTADGQSITGWAMQSALEKAP